MATSTTDRTQVEGFKGREGRPLNILSTRYWHTFGGGVVFVAVKAAFPEDMWAAYIMAEPGQRPRMNEEALAVLASRSGTKIHREFAEFMFPEIDGRYRR